VLVSVEVVAVAPRLVGAHFVVVALRKAQNSFSFKSSARG